MIGWVPLPPPRRRRLARRRLQRGRSVDRGGPASIGRINYPQRLCYLSAYVARAQARPAFRRAFEAQRAISRQTWPTVQKTTHFSAVHPDDVSVLH